MKRELVIFKPSKKKTRNVVFDGERIGYFELELKDEA